MLNELCAVLRNYFEKSKHFGEFKIVNGQITPSDFLQTNQYFRIIGSVFNDGIYKHPYTQLKDEVFEGAVWALAIPQEFVDLSQEIDTYNSDPSHVQSPYTSESFGGYSYTKATNSKGGAVTWKDVFADKLARWRKI